MKRLLFLPLALFVSGCAPTLYCHPSKTQADFDREKYDCEKVAEQSAANWGSKGNIFMIADEMNKCLRLKYGWTPCK